MIALSHIYTYMNLGLFTNITSIGLFKTYLQICLISSDSHRVLFIHHQIPSGRTNLPTISPFTPAWDVLSARSAFGTRPACRLSGPWSTCPTHSPLCGSSSTRTIDLLLSPGSSGTSAGYVSSGNGRPRSLQGGWHFDCRSRAGIPHVGSLALR